MRRILMLFFLTGLLPPSQALPKWYKGNTHTHTINSDGDSAPDEVARWYKEHRYNFVVISDHNFLTDVSGLNAVMAAREKFLVLSGEEVTDGFTNPEGRSFAIHLNAINLEQVIPPAGGKSVVEVLQANVDAINAAGAVGHINHPNFRWSLSLKDMLAVTNYHLYEIANAHPAVNNAGGGGIISTEAMWDSLLTQGKLVFGVASDDAHNFQKWGPQYSNPGRGWVWVRCDSLEKNALSRALDRGDFYSSTGVTLKDIVADDKSLTIEIDPEEDTRYTVYFIGREGKVLSAVYDNPAVYKFTGREGYVRAKVLDSNGWLAWTQPCTVKGR